MALLIFSRASLSNIFCEHTIHINSDTSNTEIMLHCQSHEKYDFCEIGILSPIGLKQRCKFHKSFQGPLKHQTFIRDKCPSESFIQKIEYKGIEQSDKDCKLRVTHFGTAGKKKLLYLF